MNSRLSPLASPNSLTEKHSPSPLPSPLSLAANPNQSTRPRTRAPTPSRLSASPSPVSLDLENRNTVTQIQNSLCFHRLKPVKPLINRSTFLFIYARSHGTPQSPLLRNRISSIAVSFNFVFSVLIN